MRLAIFTAAVVLAFSAAVAAPSPMMGQASMVGGGTLIIHHQVTDYAKWRIAYDADQVGRTAGGLTNCHVHRSMDNANDVVVACSMADVAKARKFVSSTALAETMAKAGVMGKPQILFLTPPQ